MPRRISILGSTGSIGENALRIVAEHPDRFQVAGLAAGKGWERLAEQARLFRPAAVSVADPRDAAHLEGIVPKGTAVLSGAEGLREVAAGVGAGVVVSALVGAAGLDPTLAAIDAGVAVALANKEVLVMAGEIVTRRARARGAALLPVDSEHAGIAQALQGRPAEEVRRLVLTASGGPFRGLPLDAMARITPEEALRHPTWKMGPKVTVDSATMMNKGLEVIEAHWLFGLAPERVDVVVHPQSIVHAMVEFVDGSFIAQMSQPDMRIPIAQALSYPERIPLSVRRLDLAEVGTLTFEEPDSDRFPCLCLAKAALREGGTAAAVLNAANEEAVASFLAGEVGFMDIPAVVGAALDAHAGAPASGVEAVLAADHWAREFARTCLNGQAARARRR